MKLKAFFLKKCRKVKPKISLLIPFSSHDPIRRRNFKWLIKYWKKQLPDAEIVIGKSKGRIFCKGEALNRAARKSKGKILVILDADAYLPGYVIENCANRILEELSYGNHLWYVPYRNLYRLTSEATDLILSSDPSDPKTFSQPIPKIYIEDSGDKAKYGRRYGAMIMVFPRKAYEILGCFDERFLGWGGEDVALLRALDTLFGKHRFTKNDILHMWHPFIGNTYRTRMWKGQRNGQANGELANRYNKATRHPAKMRLLVDTGCEYNKTKQYR